LRAGAGALGLDSGRLDRFVNEKTAMVLAFTDSYANSDANKALLEAARSYRMGGDMTMLVDGGTAEIVDVVDTMYGEFPKAVALIVVATYLVLLLLFRAVLLPLKAILMNTLSILASYGALVWIFQEGHLSGPLDFVPLQFVEASLPIIMFCVLFGLSMDYEVFLLSRVREEWERTGDNTASVAAGLQRSGRIITSAALIVVVVTSSFVSADVILIKALGLGIALAVFLDATIVRALLVPATMRLLGHWNWWMPDRLSRALPGQALAEE
jgi:RND superfamily putative drug exporter